MGLSKYKDLIVKRKLTEFWRKAQFEDTDIIPAVNLAWKDSFARPATNKDAMVEKGWGPFNLNLLLNEQIRMTMNEDDKGWEKNNIVISPKSMETIFAEQNLNLPEEEDEFLQPKYTTIEAKLNYSNGEAARCLDSLVSQQDLQSSRDRIRKNKDIGKMREELVSGITRLSTGNLFLADICNVGEEVAERLKNNTAKIQQQEQAAY